MGRRPRTGAVYTDMLPDIEIDNGMAFFTDNANGQAICTTMHNFERFVEMARRTIREWHAAQGEVVPFRRRKDDQRGGHAAIPKKSFAVTTPSVTSAILRIRSGDGMRFPLTKRDTVGCSQPSRSANSL